MRSTNRLITICRPSGRNSRPTKGQPVHSTATEPQNMHSVNLFFSQAVTDSISRLMHTADGRYDVEQKNIPGDSNIKIIVRYASGWPNSSEMVVTKSAPAHAANKPSSPLIVLNTNNLGTSTLCKTFAIAYAGNMNEYVRIAYCGAYSHVCSPT